MTASPLEIELTVVLYTPLILGQDERSAPCRISRRCAGRVPTSVPKRGQTTIAGRQRQPSPQ
jgi:hypothetical protein